MTFSPLSKDDSKRIKTTLAQLSEWLPKGWHRHKHHKTRFENGNQAIVVKVDNLTYYENFRSPLEKVDFQMPQSKEGLLEILEK